MTLYFDYPELWKKLAELDKESPVKFKPEHTIEEYGRRFELEGLQTTLFSEEGGP